MEQFSTAEQLRTFNTDDTDGSTSAAKVYLGENGQQWWIAGSQDDNSLVLFSASSLGDAAFQNDLNDQIFNEQAVYANHYGASQIRAKLTELAQSLFNVYENALLESSTIYTEDAKNGTVYALSDELYLGYATYTYDTKTHFYVGENSKASPESGLRVDSPYWGENFSWLRSSYPEVGSYVSVFYPGRDVEYYLTDMVLSVYPAVKIDLSKVLFGSAAPAAAADGALTLADTDVDGAFTLRYASDSLGTAEISYDKTSVMFSGVPEGAYLVVQDSNGAYAKAISGTGSVTATEMNVQSFENCKVWLEKTEDRITSATLATQGTLSAVTYFDENGKTQYLPEDVTPTKVTNATTELTATDENGGWYLVEGNVTISNQVVVSGKVTLVLADGAQLNAQQGIKLIDSAHFTITAQSTGEGTGSLSATGTYFGAGIGGNWWQTGGGITINGGVITAKGANSAAGIGGGSEGAGGTITINGGVVNATGTDGGAGIGGGSCWSGETQGVSSIVISGGEVVAIGSKGSAGIGGGGCAVGGAITISGGRVTAIDGGEDAAAIGKGCYQSHEPFSPFSTGENGNAVIYADGISDTSKQSEWDCIWFNGDSGSVYGAVTLDEDLTLTDGQTLTVPEGEPLTVPENVTLTVEAGASLTVPTGVPLTNNGTIQVNMGGSYNGDQPEKNKVTYQIDWDTDDDGTVNDTTYVAYGETPTHEGGSKESTAETVYTFTDWTPEIAAVTGTATYTAQFSSGTRTYTVTIPTDDGYTIWYSGDTELAYNSTFIFTIEIAQEYYKNSDFVVKANGQDLPAGADGRYTVQVLGNTQITVEGVAPPVISGVKDGATYYTTQSVAVTDENFASVTVNDEVQSDAAFTLPGNVEKTYTIVATDRAGNKTIFIVTMNPISSLEESIDGLTPDNVTSEDKGTVEMVKEQVESIDLEDATEDEKAAIDKILENCGALLEKIEETAQADNTENINKVENITADNVKPEDKDDLTAAKEDLENVLENFGDNYTEEEKAEIQNKLDQINNALESIEKVEAVQDAITALPDTVEPDDTEAEALINAAKEQYDALTQHEKDLISEELKEKMESLLGDLLNYWIISGNGSQWTVGDDGSLTITANGPVDKFTGIEVDGKAIDTANYTVKSGSTIITLKPDYLDTLSVGKHTLTVIYTDGETSGEFEILKKAESTTPGTGDSSNIMLWATLLLISGGVLSAVIYKKRKRLN